MKQLFFVSVLLYEFINIYAKGGGNFKCHTESHVREIALTCFKFLNLSDVATDLRRQGLLRQPLAFSQLTYLILQENPLFPARFY